MTDANNLTTQLQQLQSLYKQGVLDIDAYAQGLNRLRRHWGAEAVDAALAALPIQASAENISLVPVTNTEPIQVQQGTVEVAGDVQGPALGSMSGGTMLMPLFPGDATGVFLTQIINIYRPGVSGAAPEQADYGAALRRYLEYLYRRYGTIDLRGIDDRPMDMPLNELYVSLNLHEPPLEHVRGRGGLRSFLERARGWLNQTTGYTPQLQSAQGISPVDWSQVLRHPRIVVVGAPGSGKTTLLHYTTVRLAEILARDDNSRLAELGLGSEARQRPPVPLLLPLRELGTYLAEASQREVSGANPRLLLDCLAHYYSGFDLDLPPDFFRRLCAAGQAIVLLDGLDEITRTEDRVFVSAIVAEFVLRFRSCRYVVTARVAAYEGDTRLGTGFRICTIADLDLQQQQRFVQNWSRSLHRLVYQLQGAELEQASQRYAADLWQAIQLNEQVRALATNPLLLTVAAVIYYNNYILPEDRASLYEECIEVLLRGGRGKVDRAAQERRKYGGAPELSMGLNPRRELLAFVAYTMHQRGSEGQTVGRAELIQMVAQHLRNHPRAEEAAQAFVAELPVHIGLLDEREPGRFRFSHLSFQEFLAARYVAETDRWDELLARYRDSWWREVVLLCIGYLSQERCWRFLQQLIEQGNTPLERAEALVLATDALAEVERFKGQGPFNGQMVIEALAILEAPPRRAPGLARVLSGQVLATSGDPRRGVCTLPPDLVTIPGSNFVIGETPDRAYYDDEVNSAPVEVASFALARYPVTNAQYQLFLAEDGYNPDQPWWDAVGRAWLVGQSRRAPDYWRDTRFGQVRTNHPVVGVSWYEAQAFCCWLTQHLEYNPARRVYQLPSEAEWEFAARRTTRRRYPWGNELPDGDRTNFDGQYDGPTSVGCFPLGATVDGLFDLAGNVLEWTRSVALPYPYLPDDGRENLDDPANKRFTLRGGDWFNGPRDLRTAYRPDATPDFLGNLVGFRLATSGPVPNC